MLHGRALNRDFGHLGPGLSLPIQDGAIAQHHARGVFVVGSIDGTSARDAFGDAAAGLQ